MSRVARLVWCLAVVVGPVHAQERVLLRGTVRDVTSGLVVSGAVVSLLDSARAVLERTTSGSDGTYRIMRPLQATRLQVRRIGFRPYEQPLRAGIESLDVPMARLPSLMAGVVTRANASCPKRGDTPVAFGLWEEARSALLATVVARETQRPYVRRYRFNRVMDDERVTQMDVATDTSRAAEASFSAALSPQGFVRSGFAMQEGNSRVFYGPDADVLLSDEFLAGYCMRVADRDAAHPERVGVRFTPSRRVPERVEIDGTLWIDTVARRLTHVAYQYLLGDARLMAARPGGEVIFAEMPNGSVLIDHWTMRLVGFKAETLPSILRGTSFNSAIRSEVRPVRVINETGGALAIARWNDSIAWHGTFGGLTLHARADSGVSLDGRWIRLARSPYRTQLDASGVARLPELIAGPYNVSLEDSRLSSIGLELTVPLPRNIVRGEMRIDSLRLPTPESFVLTRCREDRRLRRDEFPSLLLRVVTVDGKPIDNARIDIAWDTLPATGYTPPERMYTTGRDGIATLCAARNLVGKRVRLGVWLGGRLLHEQVVTLAETLLVVPLMIRDVPEPEVLASDRPASWRRRESVDTAVRQR